MIDYFKNITIVHPAFLGLLLLIPAVWLWRRWRKPKQATFAFSDVSSIAGITTWKQSLLKALPIIKSLAFAFMIFALARPQLSLTEEEVKADGIDIILVTDLSSSMLAQDFQPDRLSVSKAVAQEFVNKRPYDRIGLVVFAGESYTQVPLTTDHAILKSFLADLQVGRLQDGTAIGMGLASAVNRLKDSESKSKIVILLTDGVNNAGYVKPLTAAEIAQEYDVKVYTIGVGSEGSARSPINKRSDGRYVFGMARVEIDEALLRDISEMTGGKYFRALDSESLVKIYDEIDKLEKTEIEVNVFKRYSEEFRIFLLIGMGLLLLEFLLNKIVLRSVP